MTGGGDDGASETRLPTLDEGPGPAEIISPRRAAEMTSRALAAHERRGAVAWTRYLAVAATLVLAGGGMAWGGRLLRRWQARSVAERTMNAPSPAMGEGDGKGKRLPGGIPDRPGVLELEDSSESAPSWEPNRAAARTRPAPLATGVGRPSLRVTRGASARTDLLERANTLRAQSRWRDAEHTYRQVGLLAPESDEAYAATVAAASLRLERLHDVRGALPLYRRALHLRPGGALAEEVRWGIAQAHRLGGDTASEIKALRTFISAHPESLLRHSAENRLAVLDSASGH